MNSRVCVLAACLMAVATPVLGQEAGTLELGGHAQATWFDELTNLSDATAWGAGGFAGVFFARNLAFEAALGRSWTEDATPAGVDGTWTPVRGRLVYSIPLADRIYPLLGVGGVFNDYDGFYGGSDFGLSGLIGLKGYFTDRWAVRTDLTVDHVPSPVNEGLTVNAQQVDKHTNWTLTMGLSVDIGDGRARDTDGDGVLDRVDTCTGTPLGVRVDASGCRLDGDSDGVYDEDDSCLNTPRGVRVDAEGCRVDSDGDGVFDEQDRCASTPSGVRVDATGCRVDTDGDGVFDEQDRCASTPSGVRVDATGCRVDTDGDGVFDEQDRCASTPRGTEVDASGCPALFEAEQMNLVLEGVNFETGSAILTPGARQVLDRVATSLVGNPGIRVEVSGHTDNTGSRNFNVALSQSRAESVVEYLVGQGVAENRMEARGFGPDRQIATNDTADGRAMNRRVELRRID